MNPTGLQWVFAPARRPAFTVDRWLLLKDGIGVGELQESGNVPERWHAIDYSLHEVIQNSVPLDISARALVEMVLNG
jgi:hypothetical protein